MGIPDAGVAPRLLPMEGCFLGAHAAASASINSLSHLDPLISCVCIPFLLDPDCQVPEENLGSCQN